MAWFLLVSGGVVRGRLVGVATHHSPLTTPPLTKGTYRRFRSVVQPNPAERAKTGEWAKGGNRTRSQFVVYPQRADRHGSAVAVISGVNDFLEIQGHVDALEHRQVVIDLQDLLG